LQQAVSSRDVESALVVDQGGLVLAASNNALVGLTLPRLLQLPTQGNLRKLCCRLSGHHHPAQLPG
jgi:hypothetical protein